MNLLSSILAQVTTAAENVSETTTELVTTSNPLLDENGQFVDASQAVENVTTWFEDLDLINKALDILPTVIIAIVTVAFGFILAKYTTKFVLKAMEKRNIDPSIYNFICNILSFVIKCVFVVSALSMFVNVNSFVAAFGAVGVAAGLGLQSSVSQFASGIQILLNSPFKTGDFVEINGVTGNICEIRFMNTVINTIDNKRVIIPNSHITSNHIINYTAEENRRVDLIFSISYSDDIAKTKQILTEVAKSSELIVEGFEPEIYVNSHEASSINLVAKLWCKVENYWPLYYYMQENVKIKFDENGINIPFNQLDVHIVNTEKMK